MFVRWKTRARKNGDALLSAQLVACERMNGRVRQKVIRHLGSIRLETLRDAPYRAKFWHSVDSVISEFTPPDRRHISGALQDVVPRLNAEEERDRDAALCEYFGFDVVPTDFPLFPPVRRRPPVPPWRRPPGAWAVDQNGVTERKEPAGQREWYAQQRRRMRRQIEELRKAARNPNPSVVPTTVRRHCDRATYSKVQEHALDASATSGSSPPGDRWTALPHRLDESEPQRQERIRRLRVRENELARTIRSKARPAVEVRA